MKRTLITASFWLTALVLYESGQPTKCYDSSGDNRGHTQSVEIYRCGYPHKDSAPDRKEKDLDRLCAIMPDDNKVDLKKRS